MSRNVLYAVAASLLAIVAGAAHAQTWPTKPITLVVTYPAGGGADTVSYYGTEVSVAGGAGSDTLVMNAAADVDLTSIGDQTSGDGTLVTGFENVEAALGQPDTALRLFGKPEVRGKRLPATVAPMPFHPTHYKR